MNCNGKGEPALARALARPRYEIVPLRGALEAAQALPEGAAVSVTCSPALGLDQSLEFAVSLRQARRDLHVIAHLAARRVRDRRHLKSVLARMAAAGLRNAFVIAGDRTDHAGAYDSGFALVRDLHELRADLDTVGVPGYPEGHPFLNESQLDQALSAKAPFADYVVTQLCFDAGVIRDWLQQRRAAGLGLAAYIGVPGALERRRLLGIALRIGLGDSVRFVRRHGGLAGGLMGAARYVPDDLLYAMADDFADPALGIAGVHINTFNQIEATEAWRHSFCGRLEQAVSSSDTQARMGSTG